MKKLKVLFFILGILTFHCSLALAELVTIKITGTVTLIRDLEEYPYDEMIHIGDTFTGIYTYDSATLNSGSSVDTGIYTHDSPYGFNISLGGFEFKTSAEHVDRFNIAIINGDASKFSDRYIAESLKNTPLSTGISVNRIAWSLYDNTHTAISSTDLTTEFLNLSAWEGNVFSIGCGGSPGGNATFAIWGVVTQAEIIPEPLTIVLFGLGSLLVRSCKS